jgi:hypothetical protein
LIIINLRRDGEDNRKERKLEDEDRRIKRSKEEDRDRMVRRLKTEREEITELSKNSGRSRTGLTKT